MSALTIKHTGAAAEVFAPSLEVLHQTVADRSAALIVASSFEVADAASLARANDLATVMYAVEKQIDARHEFLKRPLLDTTRLVKAAVEGVAGPLTTARKSLIAKIAAWDKKQKDAALAAQREAERIAKEQQEAAQKIANEEHAAKVKAEKDRAEQEAKELEAILGTPVAVAPVVVVPAPVVAVVKPAVVAAPVAPSAVTTRMVRKLIIHDARKVAATYQVGMEILVRIDEAAVLRAIDAGAIVDGAHIEMVEQTVMRRVL